LNINVKSIYFFFIELKPGNYGAISCFFCFIVGGNGWNGWSKHVFRFGRISSWTLVGFCHARVRDGGLSSDTMTVRRKIPPVAGIEPALVRVPTDALVRSATTPTYLITMIVRTIILFSVLFYFLNNLNCD